MKKNPTLTELNIWYFLRQGAKEIESRSRKYRVFRYPHSNENYYVGKRGAVRKGTSIANSCSLKSSEKFLRQAWANAQKDPSLLTDGRD